MNQQDFETLDKLALEAFDRGDLVTNHLLRTLASKAQVQATLTPQAIRWRGKGMPDERWSYQDYPTYKLDREELPNTEFQDLYLDVPDSAVKVAQLELQVKVLQEHNAELATKVNAMKPFLPPIPKKDAFCHLGITTQDECAHCQRIINAHGGKK